MNVTVERDALADVLQGALRIVSARSPLPVVAGVRIEAAQGRLQVAGTDLEVFLTARESAAVEEPGVVVVFGRLLGEIVRMLPAGAVRLTVGDSHAVVQSGQSRFSLATLPAEEFPAPPADVVGPRCELAADELGRALRRVVPAASSDIARQVLAGVLWSLDGETLRLVATDSYRLAAAEVVVKEGPGAGAVIVPARALAEFARALKAGGAEPAAVTMGEHQVALETGSTRIVARLVEGRYPEWRGLIPEDAPNRLIVDRSCLAEALARASLVARANIPVRLVLGCDEVGVSARSAGVADAEESVEVVSYDGERMAVGFNPRFLTDALDAFDDEQVSISFVDPGRPAIVSGEGTALRYLVMPVRLWDRP